MKLTFLIMVVCLMEVSASVYSQATKFSFNVQDRQVVDILKDIESQSDFRFFYRREQIDVTQKIDLMVTEGTVEKVLDELFRGQDVTCQLLKDNLIVITPKGVDFNSSDIIQQFVTISGRVTDSSGASLPGVTVVVKGTVQGTISNADGNYSLTNVPENATLVFSFVGMKTQEIPVGAESEINVKMVEEAIGLEEVVAIGYGTVKKSDLTGSVGSVKGSEIGVAPITNVMQSLAGRTPGVYVMQSSGEPGASMNVQIRGANSIRGSNEPLYVIDGFLYSGSDINILNNNDIESIEILKDASATAIYGSRGANGVVIITTRRGKEGVTTVDFESSYGVQTLRKKLDLMNATEYAKLYNEQAINDGLSPYFSQEAINGYGAGYDWQDLIFRTAPVYNNTLTINGGSKKTKFSLSGSVLNQQGIIKETGFERYSLRTNISHEISKFFSVEYGAIVTKNIMSKENSQQGDRGSTLLSAATVAPPTLTPYNEDGSYRLLATGHSFISGNLVNPLNYLNEDNRSTDKNSILINSALIFKLFEGLTLRIYGGAENTESRSDHYRTLKFTNSQGVADVSVSNNLSLLNENTLSYSKTINEKHSISAVAGFTYQDFVYKSLSGSGNGFLNDAIETYDLSSAASPGIPGSGYSKSVLLSYLGRINYTFNNKYLLTASIRSDGSSKYSVGDKWGYFPSAAFAWKIKEESFMKNILFINDLKLRTSWGVTGSQAINAYQTLTQLSSGIMVFGDDLYTTFSPGTLLPGRLKWESTEQLNLGFDIAFLDNRYRLTVDYYLKNTRDLLNPVSLPSSLGYSSTVQNVGQIRNQGLEFVLDSKILTGNFRWDLNANFAINRNQVIKLNDGQDILTGHFAHPLITDNAKVLREGEPLGVFYGYLTDGYDENGNQKYKDLEVDGIINQLDKTIIGDPNPDFIYGLNSFMSFKNIELNLSFQGVYGNDVLNVSGISTIDYQAGLNTLEEVYYDHWTPDNPNAKYPKITRFSTAKYSDRQIEDGSYLRLKNIQLLYNLPLKKWNVNVLSNVQVYVTGQNLLTLTSYSWWDPEINSIGQGIDQYSYPTAKTYSFGIKVSF